MSIRPTAPPLLVLSVALLATAPSPTLVLAQWAPDGEPLCTAANTQTINSIVSDFQGGAIVAWTDARAGNSNIYVQRCDASGIPLWTSGGVPVRLAPSDQENAVMIPDIANGAIVAWEDHRGGSWDVYAQRVDAQGAALWSSDGTALGTDVYEDQAISIIPDGSFGVISPPAYYVAWGQYSLPPLPNRSAVVIQRVDVNGGGLWTPASAGGVILATAEYGIGPIVMASDGVGAHFGPRGAVVAWAYHDIYAQRLNSAGIPQWAAGGISICSSPGGQGEPAIANVGGDKLVLAWDDGRTLTGRTDIYIQEVDSAGNALWLTNGLPLCLASESQLWPHVLVAGAGGAFIAWLDERDSNGDRVYAQHVDANGQPLWTLDGIPLCTTGDANEMEMAPDGAGGFIVCWMDYRVDSGDIYAQRVDANGNLLWAPEGAPLCRAAGFQLSPILVPGANNNAIVAWTDWRGSTLDVYANMVSGSGGVSAAPAVSLGTSPLLRLVSGNPTSGAARFQLQLPSARSVVMDVQDVAGRRIRSVSNGMLGAGTHSLTWDGDDESGVKVGSGVYFVQLAAGGESQTSRVVVVR